MKKLTALLLALVMVLAIGSTALATDPGTGSGSGSSTPANNLLPNSGKVTNAANAASGIVTFEKTIILFNDEGQQIYEPDIDYTYTITAVTAATGTTVTDTAGNQANVYGETAVAVTGENKVVESNTATVSFAPTVLKNAATTGSQDTKEVSFKFDATKFPHAGIFRFQIEEASDPVNPADAGIERPDGYKDTKFLDVYVRNNAAGTALEIYGFVMFDSTNGAGDSLDETKEAGVPTTGEKSSGFTPGGPKTSGDTDPDTFTDDTYCDHYKTINLTVEKKVTGLGDKTKEFPFTYTLTLPAAVKTDVRYDYKAEAAADRTAVTINANASGGATSTIGKVNGETSELNLKHGDSFQIIGVPFGTTFSVNEYNITPDKYKTTAEGTNMTLTAGGEAAGQDFAKQDDLATAIAGKEADTTWTANANKITVTNNLPEISPTGVVLRVAPYAIMLGAGIALFIILKVRKNKAVEEA